MELSEFIGQVPNFDSLRPVEKIVLFGWYLHKYKGAETFDNDAIRECYRAVNAELPNIAQYLTRMAAKKPPELIHSRSGYRLEGSIMRALSSKYGEHQTFVSVTKILSELPSKVSNLTEKTFLTEALNCYRVRAFRATIVMTWNLAFAHLIDWILTDPKRLADFNSTIGSIYPKKKGLTVGRAEDFEDLKESEVIEICRVASILSKNVIEILREKLKRRNLAAHPSNVVITQHQADDVVTDLVNNVVLILT